ncbi:MAG: L,D-transpeptidase family protein [Ginsengibacter sp.]
MKKICTLLIVIAFLLFSCKNTNNENNSSNTQDEISKKNKKLSTRDYSITKQNSYNDLFLDSTDVAAFLVQNKVPDSIALRIRSFYNTRNYQFAWFSSNGLAEQAFGFWSLKNYEGDTAIKIKGLQKTMDDLMTADSLVIPDHDKSTINTELLLTESFINYAGSNFEKGYLKRKEAERFIPSKKSGALYLADSILNKKHKDNKYFADINEPYKLLADQLRNYTSIAKNGGWPTIPAGQKYTPGVSAPGIVSIKKILAVTGDLPQPDSTELYNENLQNGIKNFEKRYGYTADGKLSASLLKEMSVPANERIQQILINMNRMRWMPRVPDGKLIVVNIPEFILHVYNGKKNEFNMTVVVGKEGHNTTIFSNKLTTIVFSPYWALPGDIVKKEILPAMERNAKYLEKHNMEIIGRNNGLPVIRQKPGGDNSLGKVKFLFPNSFNIYFHDTPAKSLFSKDVRAYSHGCIRLSEPQKLAIYLLSDDRSWTKEKIDEAMNKEKEAYVRVKNPVPVFITYYTAWVDDDGKLNFRKDIYGHDANIAGKMFTH